MPFKEQRKRIFNKIGYDDPMPESDPKSAPPEPVKGDATLLLQRIEGGDTGAAEELLPLVYEQLRAIAGGYFRGQRSNHTLQPTALVHEAYIKLVNAPGSDWRGSAHFCAVAATAMRQILANHAEAKMALKRGGGAKRVDLEQITSPVGETPIDVVNLHQALTRLGEVDERLARIVELCFFGGLTHDQVAVVLKTSPSTIARGWRQAKALLNVELMSADPG